ncbi:MAG: DUF3500 domain-containing protein [Verrucomicrobiota bacterium]
MKFAHVTTSLILALAWFAISPAQAANPVADMTKAVNDFLGSLTPEQKAKASFDLKGDEHANWYFIPKDRNGLPMKQMTPPQRDLAKLLLKSGLSKGGFGKATNIMSLELVLFDMENKSPKRDPELYYVSVFGNPGSAESWGWRVEGHHLSINFTIAGGKEISATPSFLGSNPGEVKEGPRKGVRVLASEEDLGRQLLKSLTEEQRKTAIFSTDAPKEVLTGNMRKVQPLALAGLPQTQMTKEQTDGLLKLIKDYLTRNRSEIADADFLKIEKAGIDKIYFGWAGGTERGEPHYYRIQGPTFLMEYDNTQNDANHVHAVWRDFENDFGEDLLRKHYDQVPHP